MACQKLSIPWNGWCTWISCIPAGSHYINALYFVPLLRLVWYQFVWAPNWFSTRWDINLRNYWVFINENWGRYLGLPSNSWVLSESLWRNRSVFLNSNKWLKYTIAGIVVLLVPNLGCFIILEFSMDSQEIMAHSFLNMYLQVEVVQLHNTRRRSMIKGS